MPDVSLQVNYLYFLGGPGHVRRPRPNPPTAGFVPIPGLGFSNDEATGSTLSPSQLIPIGKSFDVPQGTVTFVMLSVSGGQTGTQVWLAPQDYQSLTATQIEQLVAQQTAPVVVGTNPVTVDFIYGPPASTGSGPPGPTGASIDAFYLGTSALVDNDFVSVLPDNGATATANNDGWVATSGATETITADEYITPDGLDPNEVSAVFYKWVDLTAPWQSAEFNRATFTAAQGQSYAALALYRVDPCAGLRGELANFNLGDFPNQAAGEKALIELRQALFTCERLNGEFPVPEI